MAVTVTDPYGGVTRAGTETVSVSVHVTVVQSHEYQSMYTRLKRLDYPLAETVSVSVSVKSHEYQSLYTCRYSCDTCVRAVPFIDSDSDSDSD